MPQAGPHLEQWHTARRYPRVPLSTRVEIHARRTQGAPIIANLENVSVGGMSATCRENFDPATEVAMLFSLPNGEAIRAFGRVAFAVPGKRYGIEFTDLDGDARAELERFTQRALGYNRRSGRVPYRVRLTVRPSDNPIAEEPAMTVLASRNGGLLVCRSSFRQGQEIFLRWPEREHEAHARVVFQHTWQADQMTELGFEFVDQDNFWDMEFPAEGP